MDIKKFEKRRNKTDTRSRGNVTLFPKNESKQQTDKPNLRKELETSLEKKQKELNHLILANALINTNLFENTSEDNINLILKHGQVVNFSEGEKIVHQDANANKLYIVIEGTALVTKAARNTVHNNEEIEHLASNDIIGLLPLFDRGGYSASVYATSDIMLLALPMSFLRSHLQKDRQSDNQYLFSATEALSKELRGINKRYAKKITEIKINKNKLADASRLIVMTVIGMCVYTVILANSSLLDAMFGFKQITTLALTIFFAMLSANIILSSNRHMLKFGLGFKHSLKAIKDAMFYSMLFASGIIIIKALMITFYPPYASLSLFSTSIAPPLNSMLIYAILIAPTQEFIVRSCLQSSFYLFLHGRYRHVVAILLSNFIFSVTHLTYSRSLAVISFVAGIFWGWQFSRNRSWIAVSLSHAFLGCLFFGVVVFPGFVG